MFRRRQWITLSDVNQALDEERRSGEDRRQNGEPDKERSSVLLWALGLVGTAALALGAAQFTDLKTEFRQHRNAAVVEDRDLRLAVEEIRSEIRVKQEREDYRDRLLLAMARKLRVAVSDVEGESEGGKR